MISVILNALEKGFKIMRSNTRLLLVGVLVFVFPLLFIWITQSFFTNAYDNIHTAQKQRIGMVHDSITAILQSDSAVLQEVTVSFHLNNPDISEITVYRKDVNGFLVVSSVNPELVGAIDSEVEVLNDIGFSDKLDFQQFEYTVSGKRIWQTFKRVSVESEYLYIFTEYDLSQVDTVMNYRRQQSYFGLSAIFVFLILLAYWLNRQTFWQGKHQGLEKQLEERDLFSNMIAHEFRTPLTSIKGYASFLQESESLSADERKFADNIRTSSERLVVLVNDFLEVARLQSGKIKIEEVETDLSILLKGVVSDLNIMAKKKNLELSLSGLAKSTAIMVKTDPARMTQVLTNIVSNSIKYTNKGKIELEAIEVRDGVVVKVKDTGTGISADDQKKLFSPFTRVGGVDAGSTTGTGLGMWITRQIVNLLGGTIGVESIEGVGTHIVITFKEIS